MPKNRDFIANSRAWRFFDIISGSYPLHRPHCYWERPRLIYWQNQNNSEKQEDNKELHINRLCIDTRPAPQTTVQRKRVLMQFSTPQPQLYKNWSDWRENYIRTTLTALFSSLFCIHREKISLERPYLQKIHFTHTPIYPKH